MLISYCKLEINPLCIYRTTTSCFDLQSLLWDWVPQVGGVWHRCCCTLKESSSSLGDHGWRYPSRIWVQLTARYSRSGLGATWKLNINRTLALAPSTHINELGLFHCRAGMCACYWTDQLWDWRNNGSLSGQINSTPYREGLLRLIASVGAGGAAQGVFLPCTGCGAVLVEISTVCSLQKPAGSPRGSWSADIIFWLEAVRCINSVTPGRLQTPVIA